MRIESSAFESGAEIPSRFTCDGESINPPLIFKIVPENAKSLALIVDDPDAPSGIWVHWVLWNIPPTVTEIKEGSTPAGAVAGINSGSKNAFSAPCPPGGIHRYFFKLYALDKVFDLPATSTSEDLSNAMEGHIMSESRLMGIYQKK